jgi:hypothetical protein
MKNEPTLPHPTLTPEDVAAAILVAAVTPPRDKQVGLRATVPAATSTFAPGLEDKRAGSDADRPSLDEAPRHPEGALYQPSETCGAAGQVHGEGQAE